MKREKVLFFDIDGTIISEKNDQIPESTIRALKKVKENGHKIIINTGRTRSIIDKRLEKDIDFNGYICGCGTYVEIDSKVLYYKTIDKNKYPNIIKVLKENDMDTILEGKDAIFMDFESEDEVIKHKIKIFQEMGLPVKPYSSKNISFDKFYSIMKNKDNFEEIINYFESEGLEYIDRGENAIEVVPKDHSKASGMEILLKYLNLEKEDSYVFGDSYNDISMFKYCPNAILMGNGKKDLYDMVKFVTKDVDEDGIEYALKHFDLV